MDSLQFALILVLSVVLFLSFALTITAIIIGNHATQIQIRKLLDDLTKRLFTFFEK